MTDLNTERQIVIWESRLHEAKQMASEARFVDGPLARRFHKERIENIEGTLSLLRVIKEET
tara:strand:- start:496 stop:678 length:183 start_codon:yes stop_codon:yes gene_type:complete